MRFTIGIDRGMDFVIVTREDLMILELYAMVRCDKMLNELLANTQD